MNRIILIGNGFDIAHGLPTTYGEFIDDFWKRIAKDIINLDQGSFDKFGIKIQYVGYLQIPIREIQPNSKKDAFTVIGKSHYTNIENKFLEHISEKSTFQTWLDIENEYYEILKGVNGKTNRLLNIESNKLYYKKLDQLNSDFLEIEKLLQEYLLRITKDKEKYPANVIDKIRENINHPIKERDIAQTQIHLFEEHINDKINNFATYNQYNMKASEWGHLNHFLFDYKEAENKDAFIQEEIEANRLPKYFTKPNDIFFLNFNYTNTPKQYIDPKSNFELINIHGELDNPKNPMIFGYGDELDDDYKALENQNDNELLKNMKSIKYLETDNYRRLLSSIESEPYQVLVMGHSCGNSDRTLLNTLFEHKNCVSIKPYCFIDDDGKDNYSEIVRNISRNFKDKQSMRDKVVNKTFCTTLAQGELT